MADESVKVAVRVRPFNQREKDRNAKLIIEMQGQTTIIKNPQPGDDSKKFTFDYSYWSHDGFETQKDGFLVPSAGSVYASQQTVFDDLGQGVLKNAFAGYNCSLFAYGQTGSGKSYSLIGYGANKGIVPITCDELFKTIANNKDSNKRYEVTFAMMEIYNEQVRDLLSKENPKGGLPIRQTPDSGAFFVQGLKQVPVGSYLEISKRMEQGTASRTVASTNMNATSSRAHTIVVISFDQFIKAGSTESKKTSVMNLVDLAGSERADSTGATGDRLKEGANINKSLSALGNVIAALADLSSGSKKKIVVPYRDSVLTKLLQNALGGNSKTVMIAALSPADINYDETLSTLRYADRAKRIKTKAVVNENPVEKLIRELKMENDRLKKQIEAGVVAQPIEEEYTKGLTQQGIERLRQQMLEEAMAQLTANQEKIAATEGKGPTWEDKLNMARAESFIVTNDDRKKKEVHLVNVNEDLLLSGVVFHFLPPNEPVTIGRKDAKTPPTICLNGLNIEREHATIKMSSGEYVIQPASGSAKIKINGSVITGSTVLSHKDRILFGSSHLYVFINPLKPEADSDLPDPITWEFAQREIAQAKGYVTSETGLSVDRQIIQEQVLEILPMVSEVNAISEELNKYVTFDVVLITISSHDSKAGKGTKVMVQMTNLLTNNTWLWERGQFFNRRYLMQDMYQWWLDGDRDIKQIPKEEDPFWEPVGDALIGTANIFLQSLGYVLDFDDCLTITDFKGREEGTLNVHVSPCSQNGRSLGEEHYVDEPSELLDQPYNFKVTIRNGEILNPRYSKGLQVKYTVWGEDEQVETAMIEGTLKPQFSHSKVVSYPKISDKHLEFFDSGFITFLVYGRQVDVTPDKKLSQMSTRELRKVPQKPASYERRNTMMALDAAPDLNQLKSEMTVQQRKYDRLEYKEKRLQALCNEWEKKPEGEKKFEPFFNAIKALAFSSGIKLKTRVQILNMVLRGHQQVKDQASEPNGAQKPSKLGSISEDSKAETKTMAAADDDDAISVYMFGEDEDQFEREARSNGGFIKFERVASHFGANVNNMMESRNKLQQRRQSIMVSRRSSNASILPPPPAHLLNKAAARRTSDNDNRGSPSPSPSRTEKNSSTCLVQ